MFCRNKESLFVYWYYGRSGIFFFELRTYTVVLQEMCLNSDHYSEVILYPYMTLKQRVMCRDSPSASLVCARISQISVQGPLTVISYLYKLMT